jgi:hypothetical protein
VAAGLELGRRQAPRGRGGRRHCRGERASLEP